MSGFDLFELLKDGEVLWHRATSDLPEAQRLAEEKARLTNNPFLILDQRRQKKLLVHPSALPSDARKPQPIETSQPS